MDRLDELELLGAVVLTGSLRQAAARLRKSPASITRGLAQLEERLGVRLVDRTTRRVSPTEAGLELYEQAKDVLEGYRRLATYQQTSPMRGPVRITAPVLFGRTFAYPAIDSFLRAWPATQAELLLDDRRLDLIEYGLDAALRIGALPDSTLRARPLGRTRWIMICSPQYLADHGAPASPLELAERDTVVETWPSGPPQWMCPVGGKMQAIRLKPKIVSNNLDIQLEAARRGLGIAMVLDYHAEEDIRAGRLLRLFTDLDFGFLDVHLVTLAGRSMTPKLKMLTDHLQAEIRKALSAFGGASDA
jgi:DNA-binding transcriptional LysR family regulator